MVASFLVGTPWIRWVSIERPLENSGLELRLRSISAEITGSKDLPCVIIPHPDRAFSTHSLVTLHVVQFLHSLIPLDSFLVCMDTALSLVSPMTNPVRRVSTGHWRFLGDAELSSRNKKSVKCFLHHSYSARRRRRGPGWGTALSHPTIPRSTPGFYLSSFSVCMCATGGFESHDVRGEVWNFGRNWKGNHGTTVSGSLVVQANGKLRANRAWFPALWCIYMRVVYATGYIQRFQRTG